MVEEEEWVYDDTIEVPERVWIALRTKLEELKKQKEEHPERFGLFNFHDETKN